jgi:hypothetical protein
MNGTAAASASLPPGIPSRKHQKLNHRFVVPRPNAGCSSRLLSRRIPVRAWLPRDRRDQSRGRPRRSSGRGVKAVATTITWCPKHKLSKRTRWAQIRSPVPRGCRSGIVSDARQQANVYVIRLLGGPLSLQRLHFSGFASHRSKIFGKPHGIARTPGTSHPQHNHPWSS